MPQAPLPTADQILAREAPARRIAAYTAMASAMCTAIAMLLEYRLASLNVPDFTATDLVQTLALLQDGKPLPPSFLTAVGEFRMDNNALNLGIWALRALSLALLIPMVQLLTRAVRDRGGQIGSWVAPVSMGAFIVATVSTFVIYGIMEPGIYRTARDAGFAPADVWDAVRDSPIRSVQMVLFVATGAIAVTLGFASAQAVRVGLLPRVIGYIGVLIGLMFAFPLDSSNIVRAFWFGALAFLISGRLPDRTPPAWETGTAVTPEPRQPAAPREKPAKGEKAAGKGKNAGKS